MGGRAHGESRVSETRGLRPAPGDETASPGGERVRFSPSPTGGVFWKTQNNTTKIVSINHTTGEIVGYKNKGVISQLFNIPLNTIVNWFREGKQANKSLGGNQYTFFKLDQFIYK